MMHKPECVRLENIRMCQPHCSWLMEVFDAVYVINEQKVTIAVNIYGR